MAAEKEIIVAIEFGSSKIRGIAGRKNIDGSVQVLDIVQENARHCIRKGVIYNIDKTVLCIKTIMEKLEAELGEKIVRVYAGIGGKSLQTMRNVVSRQLETKVVISSDLVETLYQSNMETTYPDYEILQAVPQEYRIGTELTVDPVGVLSNQLEARYLNVIARRGVKEYIMTCLETAGLEVAGCFIAPLALSECILTESERRSGCVLVDFGADVTTVAVFKNNILRHMAVIPLGGNNITADVATLQIEEEEAEDLKLKYGSAYADLNSEELGKNVLINNIRTVEERELVEIIEARMEEILDNVWQQICLSGYRDKLNAGIIVTGGTSNLKNIDQAITSRMGMDKIRLVRIVPMPLQLAHVEQLAKDGTLNTLIALLYSGNRACTVLPEPEEKPVEEQVNTSLNENNENVNTESEDVAGQIEQEEVKPVKKEKKPGFFSVFAKKISELSKKMVEPEE